MSTTARPAIISPTESNIATSRVLPAEVYDLFGRLKELEHSDGSWPGADTVTVLCEWFTDLGVDPPRALTDYTVADPPAGPEGTVYLVQRDTIDGLYLFADEDQAVEYAALCEGGDTGSQIIINRSAGAQLIIDSQPCPACGEHGECEPCPVGDPGCDALGCQRHDSCLAPVATGTQVHLADEDPADSAGPEALIGIVAEPTDAETSERYELTESGARVLVAWPHHRRWEDRSDLTLIEDTSDRYR